MTDILYFGTRPNASFAHTIANAGYRIVHTKYVKGILSSVANCAGVVLQWKSKRGQQVIREAKALGMPVLVLTSKLAAAVQAGEPRADLYLEQPASNEEVASMLELVATKRPILVAAACVGGR
jgi:DNA-binding LytR/AlgR family response regulator